MFDLVLVIFLVSLLIVIVGITSVLPMTCNKCDKKYDKPVIGMGGAIGYCPHCGHKIDLVPD